MLLITRCIPPAMFGFGRARKPKEFFIFDLDDLSSPSSLPYKRIKSGKISQILKIKETKDQSRREFKDQRQSWPYSLEDQAGLVRVLVSSVELRLRLEQRWTLKCSQLRKEELQIFLHDPSSLHRRKTINQQENGTTATNLMRYSSNMRDQAAVLN